MIDSINETISLLKDLEQYIFDYNIEKYTTAKTVLEDIQDKMEIISLRAPKLTSEEELDALNKKKHVVTANKALIAHDAKELFTAARENSVNLYYEASVGGGIPVVVPAKEDLVANNINKIDWKVTIF